MLPFALKERANPVSWGAFFRVCLFQYVWQYLWPAFTTFAWAGLRRG